MSASTDGGNSWNDRSLALPIRAVTQVAADPIDPFTVYVTFSGFAGSSALSGHIYKSTDGGNNWTDMSGNLPDIPVNDLAISEDGGRAVVPGDDEQGQGDVGPVEPGPGLLDGFRYGLGRIGVGRERRTDPHLLDPTGDGFFAERETFR